MNYYSAWHYSCNNKYFNNKYKAIDEHNSSGQPLLFKEPEWYNNVNFSFDSPEDWEIILKNYCQEIRRNHKRVRLYFSGGIDSKLILDTFVKHKILIDEIAVVKSGIPEYDFELDDFAIPYLKKIQHLIPNTKITIQTSGIRDYYDLYVTMYWHEEISNRNVEPHLQLTTHMFEQKELEREQDTINIYGKEKPRIIWYKNEWWTYFLDNIVEPSQKDLQCRLNFYIDNPYINMKQCHMLAQHIEQNFQPHQYNHVCDHSVAGQFVWNRGSGRLLYDNDFIKKITYDNETFELNGRIFRCTTYKEKQALMSMAKNAPEVAIKWHDSLTELSKFADGKWFNFGRPELGTVGIVSKFYSLTTGKIKTVDELFPNGFQKKYLP